MSVPAATRRALVAELAARFAAAGLDTPQLDARLLVQHALGLDHAGLLIAGEAEVAPVERDAVAALAARRLAREPVSRILGRRGFWTLDLAVSPATLDPRPDTETVVEAALDLIGDRQLPWRILDLGTGTGCLLLALLDALPNATGLGIDQSAAALAVATANAARLGFAGRAGFQQGDWTAGLDCAFDLVVSNPPYIPDGDIAGLAPEVRDFDPWAALAGGADGLDAYRAIARGLGDALLPGGLAVLELGAGQADAVSALFTAAGFAVLPPRADLAGIARALPLRRPAAASSS